MRKNQVSLIEIAGRLNEISTTGNPVLITSGHPSFVGLDELITDRGNKSFKYIVGIDTFNAIVDDKYNPSDDYLNRFYGNGSSFIVVPRYGFSIVNNYRSEAVSCEPYLGEFDSTISSTRVRNGELNLTPESARSLVASRLGFDNETVLSINCRSLS